MLRSTWIIACLLFASSHSAMAQPDRSTPPKYDLDQALQQKLELLTKDFKGDVGLYVRHLSSGREAKIEAHTSFPTASLIKVPILLKVFDSIEKGELDYHQKLIYRDSLLYPGEDILGAFRDSAEISLSKAIMLMITTSDNTASLWLQELCGTGTEINSWLSNHGFTATRVNSRTPGREGDRQIYGWGQTTPYEMAEMLAMIREGRAISPRASETMYRILTRIYWNEEALSQIPPYIQAASKQGAVSHSRSEVVLVNAPSGDYVFAVITKNQEDKSWEANNEGFVLLRDVSRVLWQHFEPEYSWKSTHTESSSEH